MKATNVFFTDLSLAVQLQYSIVYRECYWDLNDGRIASFGV
jgi:hypothetical protein